MDVRIPAGKVKVKTGLKGMTPGGGGILLATGHVTDGTVPTTDNFSVDLPSQVNDFYSNAVLVFTTGACKGITTQVVVCTGKVISPPSDGRIYVNQPGLPEWNTLPIAPSAGDSFSLYAGGNAKLLELMNQYMVDNMQHYGKLVGSGVVDDSIFPPTVNVFATTTVLTTDIIGSLFIVFTSGACAGMGRATESCITVGVQTLLGFATDGIRVPWALNDWPAVPADGDTFDIYVVNPNQGILHTLYDEINLIVVPDLLSILSNFNYAVYTDTIAAATTPTPTQIQLFSGNGIVGNKISWLASVGSMVGTSTIIAVNNTTTPPTFSLYPQLPGTPVIGDTVIMWQSEEAETEKTRCQMSIPSKTLVLSDNPRNFDETERSTTAAAWTLLKHFQLYIPAMPGDAVVMGAGFGLKAKWLDKFDTGGSGNTKIIIRDAAGVVALTSGVHAIVADTYGAQSEIFYQNTLAALAQPLQIELWGQSTTALLGISAENYNLCYDLADFLPAAVIDP